MPNDFEISEALGLNGQRHPVKRIKGNILDEDVMSGRYISIAIINNCNLNFNRIYQYGNDSNCISHKYNFRYVPNPTKVLTELVAFGKGKVEQIRGIIVAGDPAELDVFSLKGNFRV